MLNSEIDRERFIDLLIHTNTSNTEANQEQTNHSLPKSTIYEGLFIVEGAALEKIEMWKNKKVILKELTVYLSEELYGIIFISNIINQLFECNHSTDQKLPFISHTIRNTKELTYKLTQNFFRDSPIYSYGHLNFLYMKIQQHAYIITPFMDDLSKKYGKNSNFYEAIEKDYLIQKPKLNAEISMSDKNITEETFYTEIASLHHLFDGNHFPQDYRSLLNTYQHKDKLKDIEKLLINRQLEYLSLFNNNIDDDKREKIKNI